MLVVVLRREVVPLSGHYVVATTFAAVDTRVRRGSCRFVDAIEGGAVVLALVVEVLIYSHWTALSAYRNRLDPETEPDNLSGAVSAHAHRRLLVNLGGMIGGRVGSSAPIHVKSA